MLLGVGLGEIAAETGQLTDVAPDGQGSGEPVVTFVSAWLDVTQPDTVLVSELATAGVRRPAEATGLAIRDGTARTAASTPAANTDPTATRFRLTMISTRRKRSSWTVHLQLSHS